MTLPLSGWNLVRLSENTWKAVESDKWKQFPIVYIIVGIDKIVVIDTGTGQHDIKLLIDHYINKNDLPYLILLTHIHFDHIGGVKYFTANKEKLIDICLAETDKTFSLNYETTCLSMAHAGAGVTGFEVTRWIKEGDVLYLNDQDKENENLQIKVLSTPGHTPDSASFWYPKEKRLFVGDILYPFAVIHLDCIGSNLLSFIESLAKLQTLCDEFKGNGQVEETQQEQTFKVEELPKVKPTEKVDDEEPLKLLVKDFCGLLQLSPKSLSFDPLLLIELNDYDVNAAVNFYLSNSEHISTLFPVSENPAAADTNETGYYEESIPIQKDEVKLSCGHIESDLPPDSIDEVLLMIDQYQNNLLQPIYVDDDYAEFSNGKFSLMIPKVPHI